VTKITSPKKTTDIIRPRLFPKPKKMTLKKILPLMAVFALGFTACTPTGSDTASNVSSNTMGSHNEVATTTETVVLASADYLEDEPEYVEYSQALREELHGQEPYVIFFHADWCPTCQALEADIKKELSTFPNGTKILKANFDKEQKLKQEYGIVMQSTLVFIDAEGNHVKTLAAPYNKEIIDSVTETL